jgi:hypothetical protein
LLTTFSKIIKATDCNLSSNKNEIAVNGGIRNKSLNCGKYSKSGALKLHMETSENWVCTVKICPFIGSNLH